MKGKFTAVLEVLRKCYTRLSLIGALCLLPEIVGCATPKPVAPHTSRPVALYVPLGNIGVVATSTVPWFDYRRPTQKGQTAFAEQYAEQGLNLGGGPEFGQAIFVAAAGMAPCGALLLLPSLAAGVGGLAIGEARDIWNQTKGFSREKLASADASLYKFISETSFQEALRASVGAEARRRTSLQVTVVKKPFPEGQEKEFSKMLSVMAGTLAWVPPGQNPRTYLERQSIDTVLELRVHEHGLKGKRGNNPNLRLLVDVEARLVRLRDSAELCRQRMIYRSSARKYMVWTDGNAQSLRAEFAFCCQSMSQTILQQLLPLAKEPAPAEQMVLAGAPSLQK